MNGVKTLLFFGVDDSSSTHHTDNRKKKDIPILGEVLTDGLDDTTITVEATYSANITRSRKKICFSLNYNVASSFSYANGVKIFQFKAKDYEIKLYSLCFENISKNFTVDDMKTK